MKHCYTNIQEHDWSTAYTIEASDIDNMPVSNIEENIMTEVIDIRPVHLFFSNVPAEIYNNYADGLKVEFSKLKCKVFLCQSWDQLGSYIRDYDVKSIAFCPDEVGGYAKAYEVVNMTKTLSKLLGKNDIKTSIAVFKNGLDVKTIKDLQKSGVDCMIPAHMDFGWIETQKGLDALWSGIPYWPKHIIEQLPGAKKTESKTKPGEIKLTPRQTQILHLIKDRGASNKVIAKHLNITESTVKLHVSIVLKKYNVKNRTQLALFSA